MKQVRCLFILLFCATLVSAQERDVFTAFATNPVRTPDTLHEKWNEAETVAEKFRAAQDLFLFFQTTGAADSVFPYSRVMDSVLRVNDAGDNKFAGYKAELYWAQGNAYEATGLYDEALRNYIMGIEEAQSANDEKLEEKNKLGQAAVYFLRNEIDKAIAICEGIIASGKDKNAVQLANKQLGTIYLAIKDYKQAGAYYSKTLDFFVDTKQPRNELEVKLGMAAIAEANGKPDSAFTIYTAVKDRAMEKKYFDLYIKAGSRLGEVLLQQKDYDQAKIILSMVYINAIQWADLEGQEQVLRSLQKMYNETGDYKNAYATATQLREVTQQISSRQNRKEVNELEIKFNTAEKEKQLLVKENQLQRQRTIRYALLIGFLVVMLPIIGLLYVYYQKLQTQSRLNASREEANQQRVTAMLREKELEVLKASIDGEEKERSRISKELHDSIGGNLAAIKMQLSNSGNSGSPEVIRQLDETYQQVRDISHNLAPKTFINTGFVELVQNYLDRFTAGGKVKISFGVYPDDVADAMDTALKVELFKIIQELMTNVQKHAEASAIEIQLTRVDGELKLIFEDNGKGFPVDETSAGIGLQNIKARLNNFKGTLAIDSFPGRGTVVDISIPVNEQKK